MAQTFRCKSCGREYQMGYRSGWSNESLCPACFEPDSHAKKDTPESGRDSLKGLGGWLIFIGFMVVTSPIDQCLRFTFINKYLAAGRPWETLGMVGAGAYPGFIYIAEIALSLCIFALSVCMIYFFFSKHHWFPRIFIAYIVVILVDIPLHGWLLRVLFPNETMITTKLAKGFIGELITAAVWIPYMFKSERVKATFVEKLPETRLETSGVGTMSNLD